MKLTNKHSYHFIGITFTWAFCFLIVVTLSDYIQAGYHARDTGILVLFIGVGIVVISNVILSSFNYYRLLRLNKPSYTLKNESTFGNNKVTHTHFYELHGKRTKFNNPKRNAKNLVKSFQNLIQGIQEDEKHLSGEHVVVIISSYLKPAQLQDYCHKHNLVYKWANPNWYEVMVSIVYQTLFTFLYFNFSKTQKTFGKVRKVYVLVKEQ